jgi:Flp pilus assembly protein TadD
MALQQNPLEPSALANLAVLDAGTGDVTTAVTLLNRLVSADPTQTSAGLNLAFIECRLGEPGGALALLARLAQYNPDDPALYNLQATGSYNGQHCDLLQGGSSHAQN